MGLGYLGPQLKALSVDGVTANAESVRNGSYPLSRPLYLVTPGQAKGAVKRFLNFVRGPKDREIAQMEGFVPAAQ